MKLNDFLARINTDGTKSRSLVQLCEDDLGVRLNSSDFLRRQLDIGGVSPLNHDFITFELRTTEDVAARLGELGKEHVKNLVALAQYRQVWKQAPEGDELAVCAEWQGYKLQGERLNDKYVLLWKSFDVPITPALVSCEIDEEDEIEAKETMALVRSMPLDNFPEPRTIVSMSLLGLKTYQDFVLYWRSITGNTIRSFAPLPAWFPDEGISILS